MNQKTNPLNIVLKKTRNLFIHSMFVLALLSNAMALVFKQEGSFVISMGLAIVGITLAMLFKNMLNLRGNQIAFALFCFVLLIFSFLPADTPQAHENMISHFRWFLLAGVGSLLIINYDYDYELLMVLLIIASLLMAPIVLTSNYSRFDYDAGNDEWMMAIYNIIPFIIAAINYLFTGRNVIVKILSVICLVLYFPMFILHTPRGAVVTIIFSIFIFFIQKMITNGVSWQKLIIRGLFLILIFVIAFEIILSYLQGIADQFELAWLEKFVFDEDVSNGRTPLYQMAIDGFLQSPIWGNGIASFENYSGSYPHNLFLQMLYETGLLMFLPVSYLIYKALLIILLRKRSLLDYRLVTFLFIISIIQLSFSSHFWMRQQFWMLIWMMLGTVSLKKPIKNIKIKREEI